jgi:predicted nucleic acid-binding protein
MYSIWIFRRIMKKKYKLYVDLCIYNRPFDDQSQARIVLETHAFIHVLDLVEIGELVTINSDALIFENDRNPDMDRKDRIRFYLDLAKEYVPFDKAIIDRAIYLRDLNFQDLDALHLACAENVKADYFLTCDDEIIRKAGKHGKKLKINVISLLQFITTGEE